MLADILTTQERLIGLRFSPFLALIIAFVIVLGGVIAAGFGFFWGQITKERARQDKIREERNLERSAERQEVDARLNDWESHRQELREKIHKLEVTVTRLSSCPKAGCPMRPPR